MELQNAEFYNYKTDGADVKFEETYVQSKYTYLSAGFQEVLLQKRRVQTLTRTITRGRSELTLSEAIIERLMNLYQLCVV